MTFASSLIPRYHPQLAARGILRARKEGDRRADWAPTLKGWPGLEEGRNLFAFSSGSAALEASIQALDLPPGGGVALPVYVCGTVFEAVRSAGLRCVFVDLSPETFEFDLEDLRRKRGDLSAVILVHLFGHGGDVAAAREAAGEAPVIEDCAHALGSTDGSGRQVGMRGTAGIFSFGVNKPLSAGGGGVAVSGQPAVCRKIGECLEALPLAGGRPTRGRVLRRALRAAVYRPPWYGLARAAGLAASQAGDAHRQEPVVMGRMGALDRALLAGLWGTLDGRLVAQRAWAGRLAEAGDWMQPACRFVQAGEAWNAFFWPVLLPDRQRRDDSIAYFRKRGIDAFRLWPQALGKAENIYGYRRGQCPQTEDALDRLLLLPCYAELSDRQRERILRAVRDWPAAVRVGD